MKKLQITVFLLSNCVIAGLIILLSHIGYGHAVANVESVVANKYQPTQLTVVYGRNYLTKSDFIHLKIDTTYHTRGKKGYQYEVFCNHEISLYSFNNSSRLNITNDACFVEGSSRKWLRINNKASILGYDCDHALMNDGVTSWEAWYCNALPHTPDIKHLKRGYEGLILAACNKEKSYTLKAIEIKHTTI